MIEIEKSPLWMQKVIHSLSSTQHSVLHNNIYDLYPCYDTDYGYVMCSLSGLLAKYYTQLGYDSVLMFEPTKGFSLLDGDKKSLQPLGFSFEESEYMNVTNLDELYDLLHNLLSSTMHTYAVIFNFTSALKELSFSKSDYNDFFFKLFRDSLDAHPIDKNTLSLYNQTTFLFKDMNDFPTCYDNIKIHSIQIPKPDREIRKTIIRSIIPTFEKYKESSQEYQEKVAESVASLTENMYGKELLNILIDAKKSTTKELIEFIQTKKLHSNKNPWLSLQKDEILNLRSKLQEHSFLFDNALLDKIDTIIKSAYFNFANLESLSFLEKPRAVMLFSGYHHDEQIELADSLSQLLFKNQDSSLKVDMKEYSDISDATKFFNNLHSHINNFPYGIILFEDIQKAHQDLLDSAFDIIKYGKIVKGDETLYFHGYIIILTFSQSCNELEAIKLSQDRYQENIASNNHKMTLKTFLNNNAKSAELYMELKNNIIHFKLFNVEQATAYLKKLLEHAIESVKVLHKISIVLEDQVREAILTTCLKATQYYCSAELKTIFHTIFVLPLTNLFLAKESKESGVIVIKSLQNSRFEADFI